MTKKTLDQNMSYNEELLSSIEPNFIFSKKPINRFKNQKTENNNKILDKRQELNELKKLINSIQNCNLKNNSQNLILGDGNLNSPVMIIGEAPGLEEDKIGKTFQGESGDLLEKMLNAINLSKQNVYSSYVINFRPPNDRKPTTQEIKRYSIHFSIRTLGFIKKFI